MGILDAARAELRQKAQELVNVQDQLDMAPLNNEDLWQKELYLILEVNEAYKNYINLLLLHKEILGKEEYKEHLLEAHSIARTGRPYLN